MNPLYFHENAVTAARLNIDSFPERIEINGSNDIHAEDRYRFVVKDEEINVYIAAAMPNPVGSDAGKEWVSILNLTDSTIDLDGWCIWDPLIEDGQQLTGTIDSGNAMRITGLNPIVLKNSGATIELWEGNERIDRVSYRASEARKPGVPIVFAYRTNL